MSSILNPNTDSFAKGEQILTKKQQDFIISTPVIHDYFNTTEGSSQGCYTFCPKCGIDTTQFSHEDSCPHAHITS